MGFKAVDGWHDSWEVLGGLSVAARDLFLNPSGAVRVWTPSFEEFGVWGSHGPTQGVLIFSGFWMHEILDSTQEPLSSNHRP